MSLMDSWTDQSWFKIAVVQPSIDGRLVLLPEVEVAVRETGSSLQPALQHSRSITLCMQWHRHKGRGMEDVPTSRVRVRTEKKLNTAEDGQRGIRG